MDEGPAMLVSPKFKNMDWDELRLVMLQALDTLEFMHIAVMLGFHIANAHHQSFKFVNLRIQFIGGFWEKCTETLCKINGLSQKHVSGAKMEYLYDFLADWDSSKWMFKRFELALPSVAPTLNKLESGNVDCTAIIWEVPAGWELRRKHVRLLGNEFDSLLVLFPRPQGPLFSIELAVTPNGSWKIIIHYDAADDKGEFTVRRINTDNFWSFKTGSRFSVTEDCKSLISNLINHEIHVLDLNRHSDKPLIYWNLSKYLMDIPCIGGDVSSFLVSGTGNSKVCIWNRRRARQIAVLILSGHTSVVVASATTI